MFAGGLLNSLDVPLAKKNQLTCPLAKISDQQKPV